MCTRLFIPIKSVAVRGLKYSFVPCGKCYDCQTLQRNEWGTRLRLQIDSMPDKDDYWATFRSSDAEESQFCAKLRVWI